MPDRSSAQAVVVAEDAALADQEAVRRNQRGQPLGGFETGLEGAQIAVVDADQPRAQFQRALGLGLVMHLDQHVHAEFEGRVFQRLAPRRRRRSP